MIAVAHERAAAPVDAGPAVATTAAASSAVTPYEPMLAIAGMDAAADVAPAGHAATASSELPAVEATHGRATPAEPMLAEPAVQPLAPPPALPPAEPPAPARGGRPFNPYLSNTPELRARRLARALVSDLVAYNPQKREEGLRDGTLRQLFREEIRKSWEEYVEQVGPQVAESTPHFQDALNDVLAGGRRVF